MSNYQADAFVVVRANTKPFRDELLKTINQFERKAVRLKIVPDTRGFQKLLRTEVFAAASKVTARVKVVPDTRAFRAAVREATKGIPVTTAGPARGGGTTGVAAPRTRGPQPVLSAGGKPLAGAAADARKEALERQKTAATIQEAVRKAEIKAHAENLRRIKVEEAAELVAIEKAKVARLAAIKEAQAAGLVSKTGQPLFGAAALAKSEALAREKEQLKVIEKIQAAEIKAWAANIKRDKERAAADEAARRAVLADLEKQGLLSKSGKPLTGAARDAKLEANQRLTARLAEEKTLAAQKARDEQAAYVQNLRFDRSRAAQDLKNRQAVIDATAAREAQTQLARGTTRRARAAVTEAEAFVPDQGLGRVAAQKARLQAANLALAKSEAAFTSTIGTNNRALQQHAGVTLRDARALQVLQTETLKDTILTEQNSAAKARNASFLGRGFGAQLAQFAGLRGAVLAANAQFIAGTVAAIAFGKAVSSSVSFTSELNVFKETADATEQEMVEVSAAARELGRDITLPAVGAQDAAEAMALLSRAGLSVQDSIDGARGVLQLGTAAQLENAEAVKLTASALNAFGLAGNQAVHVADVLTNSANASQGEISDMGIALQQASAVARQAGVSLEDTAVLLTLLAKNGIQGSDAGTSLRVALTRLQAPTKKAAAELDRLNVSVRDSAGNVRPEVFAEIVQKLNQTGDASARARALFVIFGQDAQRAASIFGREGIPGLTRMRTELDETGSAARLAGARMTGLRGSGENLKNQLADLGLSIGDAAVPAIQALTDEFAELISGINDAIEKLKDFEDKLDDLPGSKAIQSFIGDVAGEVGATVFGGINPKLSPRDKEDIDNSGAEARSAIEDSARKAAQGAVSYREIIQRSLDETAAFIRARLADVARNVRAGQIAAVRGAQGQAAGLEEEADRITAAGGTPQQERANLVEQAAAQQRIIDKAGVNAAGVQLESRRAAQAKLASINASIRSIDQQIIDDAKTAREKRQDDAKQARKEADDEFFSSLVPARERLDRQEIIADGTERLNDNLAVQKALKKLVLQEIQGIFKTVQDQEERRDAIRERRTELVQITQDIAATEKQIAEDLIEDRRNARDAVTEMLSKQITLAELRLGPGGEGKQALLRVIAKAIKDAQDRIKNWKKLGLVLVDEKIALEQLKDKRDEVIKAGKDSEGKQGTTAFDLLTQAAQTFQQSGGNLITGQQPFSGPDDFTADIAQFLTSKHSFPQNRIPPSVASPSGKFPERDILSRNDRAHFDRLTNAIERNTDSREEGNSAAGDFSMSRYVGVTSLRAMAMGRFWEGRLAREQAGG